MTSELITITKVNGRQAVNARELHAIPIVEKNH